MSYLFFIARERDHFARERDLFARECDLFAFPRHNITHVLSGAPCIYNTQYIVRRTLCNHFQTPEMLSNVTRHY